MLPEAPPAVVSPPAVERPAEVRETFTIAGRDREAVLSRPGHSEDTLVRQHIFVSVLLKPAVAGVPAAPHCTWSVRTFIQRQICFQSLSGLTGCTEPASSELAEKGDGALALTDLPPDEAVCDASFLPMIKMREHLIQQVRARSTKLFDEDLRLRVSGALTASGAKLRWK